MTCAVSYDGTLWNRLNTTLSDDDVVVVPVFYAE